MSLLGGVRGGGLVRYFKLLLALPGPFLIHDFVIGFVTRVTLVEQELLALPEHLSSPPAFSIVRVARSLVF